MSYVRKEIIGDATLYLGDCLEVLPTLGKVDAVVTDPPYGVLDESWDSMDERQLMTFSMQWIGMVSAMTDRAFVFFGERRRSGFATLLDMAFPNVRQLIWEKNTSSRAANRFFYGYESIYYCFPHEPFEVKSAVRPKDNQVGKLIMEHRKKANISRAAVDIAILGKKTSLCYRWEEGDCLPSSEHLPKLKELLSLDEKFDAEYETSLELKALCISGVRDNLSLASSENAARSKDILKFPVPSNKLHPCEKPVGLIEKLLESVDENLTILDPFMGSGTTGVACAKMHRKFIGIEKELRYFDIARRRIDDAYRHLDLFNETHRHQEAISL